ncbi:hypothetical protein RIF29_32792 [Crotalaria pallida]|uniref:Protein kinase domain-containing protein n=1 Tax=Crotalaria pallida TaxID=3830 RepID=A0AAN9HVZ3_CROPI
MSETSSRAYHCAEGRTMRGSGWRAALASTSFAFALSYSPGDPSYKWKREDGSSQRISGAVTGNYCCGEVSISLWGPCEELIDILSCMRHPNMVLLLGACPEYGILIYEYMANGSLDDCLFRKKKSCVVLPWQLRIRIAAEIATGLLFLHQAKPEPLVHRDLKPGNILLDKNYVCKISDVGLARLINCCATISILIA